MTADFFIFPNCVEVSGEMRVDITGNQYSIDFSNHHYIIDLDEIPLQSVFCLLYDCIMDVIIPIKHWEKLTGCLQLRSMEALNHLQQNCIFQLYYYNNKPFVKVFLPAGQQTLISNTHDFSLNRYLPVSFIHPVDYLYLPTVDVLSVNRKNGKIMLEINMIPPITGYDVYATYGDFTIELKAGVNKVIAPYCKKERLYFGAKEERKKGLSFDIEELLCTHN